MGLGAVSKYADDVVDLADDTFGSVYKKKIASESSEYVDDIVRNTDVKQPKNTSSVSNVSSTGTLDDGLNFSNIALEHMGEKTRELPIQTLQDTIRYGNAMPDPRGSSATMYYTTMYKNGKMYNLEVLYDEATNTIYHFEYARKAMGNLPAISK